TCDNPQQLIYFYSGMGTDMHEETFYLGSTICDNTAFTVFAMDTVITLGIPDGGEIMMTIFADQGGMADSATRNDVIIMGSGKANNFLQRGDYSKKFFLDSEYAI
ncbi:hypothetical protein PFISCL1PPCAC_3100, partial [Pristionchus fissidentatus]